MLLHLHQTLLSVSNIVCENVFVCVCVESQVSALTLSSDITQRQYLEDKSERCHFRRAKAF